MTALDTLRQAVTLLRGVDDVDVSPLIRRLEREIEYVEDGYQPDSNLLVVAHAVSCPTASESQVAPRLGLQP